MEAIYDAEIAIKGKKKGSEKLDYVVKKYSETTGSRSYKKSQEQIIKVFSLTNLSK